ncbi:unnamed protein product [Amoebophrya sp. A25]|nr:unnamed protein product [Amoebophrya sp. A25]|eukprot:GSA25T00013853001.1
MWQFMNHAAFAHGNPSQAQTSSSSSSSKTAVTIPGLGNLVKVHKNKSSSSSASKFVPVIKQNVKGIRVLMKRVLPWESSSIAVEEHSSLPVLNSIALPTLEEMKIMDHQSLFDRVKRILEAHKPQILDYNMTTKQKIDFLKTKTPTAARCLVSSHLMHVRGESVKDWAPYLSSFRSYLNFCVSIAECPFPVSADKLQAFLCIHRMDGSANVSKCALRKISEVLRVPFPSVPELRSVMAGIRRNQPMRRVRDPVSPAFLNKILADTTLGADFRMLFSVCWMFLFRLGDEAVPLCKYKDLDQFDRTKKLTSHSAAYADDNKKRWQLD